MTESPTVVRTVAALRAKVAEARKKGERIGLVPTMGALHHGHLSLVEAVASHADFVVVSIFVNPTQFGEGEDFEAYPRDESEDLEKLSTTKAVLVYAPDVTEMYPAGDATKVSVRGISALFEGAHRPGHFDGVATVVSKLLIQCGPDVAVFGEKDFQQLAVIRQFVRDLALPVKILGAPIVREHDGLAASSRNAYLSGEARKVAGRFNSILRDLVKHAEAGGHLRELERAAQEALLAAGFDAVDYVSIVNPNTLELVHSLDQDARVLAVARLEKVRLLDNMVVKAV